jgi:hypothetical protein
LQRVRARPMLRVMSFRPWLLFTVLWMGCTPVIAPAPVFVEADAWCPSREDVELGAVDEWTFWADVDHADGPRAVSWVVVEIALELGDGQLDSVYVAELEYQSEGEWSGNLLNGATAADCDSPEPYAYLWTAAGTDGNQGFYDVYESLE